MAFLFFLFGAIGGQGLSVLPVSPRAQVGTSNWSKRREVQEFLTKHPGHTPDGWPDRNVPGPLPAGDILAPAT